MKYWNEETGTVSNRDDTVFLRPTDWCDLASFCEQRGIKPRTPSIYGIKFAAIFIPTGARKLCVFSDKFAPPAPNTLQLLKNVVTGEAGWNPTPYIAPRGNVVRGTHWWSGLSLTECADCGTSMGVKVRYQNEPARCERCHTVAMRDKLSKQNETTS